MRVNELLILFDLFLNLQYNLILCELYIFEPPNLKTVLFKETDLMARCWSTQEVNLLLNRRVMQDLIPRKIPRDLALLLKYLKTIEEIVTKIPAGINQTLVMTAMGDVIGGYLQAIVIPIANEAYYAGNVDYATVAQLHSMLDKWKWYLSTDGGTWSQECDMRKISTKVATLDLSFHDSAAACQELYVSASSPPNETDYLGSQTVIAESSRVAIPYFDNNLVPNAIALPFKKRNLYSLMDPKAAYILVKYYTLTMRCLSGNANDILAFNNFFHLWIVSKVVPHLHDQDRWYPAFGAVMRVVETIKQKGLASSNPVFVQPMGDEHQDAALNTNLDVGGSSDSKHSGKIENYFHILNNPYAFLIIFIIIIMFLSTICCLCACCCFRFRQKNRKSKIIFSDDSNDNILKNAIISLYCGLKDSLTGSGSKLTSDTYGDNATQDKTNDHQPVMDYGRPELLPYPHNTPYTNPANSTDVSLSLTSDSEGEYSTTSRD